jgi:hypothetical protein
MTTYLPLVIYEEPAPGDPRAHASLRQGLVKIPTEILAASLRELALSVSGMLEAADQSSLYGVESAEIIVAIDQDGTLGVPSIANAHVGTSSQLRLVFKRRNTEVAR